MFIIKICRQRKLQQINLARFRTFRRLLHVFRGRLLATKIRPSYIILLCNNMTSYPSLTPQRYPLFTRYYRPLRHRRHYIGARGDGQYNNIMYIYDIRQNIYYIVIIYHVQYNGLGGGCETFEKSSTRRANLSHPPPPGCLIFLIKKKNPCDIFIVQVGSQVARQVRRYIRYTITSGRCRYRRYCIKHNTRRSYTHVSVCVCMCVHDIIYLPTIAVDGLPKGFRFSARAQDVLYYYTI